MRKNKIYLTKTEKIIYNISQVKSYLNFSGANVFQESRKDKILELLKKNKGYSTKELSNSLNIPISTIHRDLNELVKEDKIIKSHGGVKIKFDEVFANRIKVNSEKKIEIAKKSLELINDSDSLFLDNSTTCYYLAKEISKSDFRNLVIITNSYIIPGLFKHREDMRIISTGGDYFSSHECFAGSITLQTIREFNGNISFFSISAISIETGLSDIPNDLMIGDFKKEMAARSKVNICLVDSTKFNKIAPKTYYSLDDIDRIITDSGIDEETIKSFEKINKEILIAE